ncbi:hypothetical protein [Gluconobacter kondonii]|uniref:hypothetical protein n=1 Tax=Gluconobacter kondonii TaxID=941463 RepID=UPI001B8CA6BD|nr:hypothetical protein [Gluconobacter kondonii]MBS1052820.1 hypothetical protein [Gluconobacter kondonii]MBS1056597.1 hypothetical protein [Gluconobacter kondonii]
MHETGIVLATALSCVVRVTLSNVQRALVLGLIAPPDTKEQDCLMVQNFTPPWKSVVDTGVLADLVKSTQVAAALGNKVDADGGQSIRQSIQSGTIDAASTLDGASVADVLASSIRASVASIAEFLALTISPAAVMLTSWDGTDLRRGAAGLFVRSSEAGVSDFGTIIVTAGGTTYRRVYQGGLNPQWFGAVGDGNSHKLSGYFSTLAEAQAVFPIAYSLDQEFDFVAIQTVCNSGQGISSPALHYIMCNDAVALDDNPLIWISGTSFGDFTNSILDFTALKAVNTVMEYIDDPTFATGNASGAFVNASIYSPAQITDVVFEKGMAVYTDPANATQITGSVSGGVLTVTAMTGNPDIKVGDPLYDSQWKLGTQTTITGFGTGTGRTGTYTLSNTTATIAASDNNNMSTATGHWNQFGQKLTLPKGAYTFEIEYSCTLGGSYAMLNSQPGSIGLGVNSGSPGSGQSSWVMQGPSVTLSNLSDVLVTGSISVPLYVPEDSTQFVVVSVSGYVNATFTRFSVTKLNRNTAVLSTRDGATEHYPLGLLTKGFSINGPGRDSGLTGIWYNSYENIDGTVQSFQTGSVNSFGVGINYGSGAYLSEYWDFSVGDCGVCVQFLQGSINAGENYRWYGGSLGNSACIINNPGGGEFTFYGTSLDYSDQCIINNAGRIETHGCHMEMMGPSAYDKPLYHCKGSGAIICHGGMFLGAGNHANFSGPPVFLETNMSQMIFHETQLYNLTCADGRALRGPGQLKIRSSVNTGNANVGTYNNWTSDPLGLAGFFIPQSKSVLTLNGGVGLTGGLYSEDVAGIDQWTSQGASAALSTDYMFNGYPASLKVQTQGQSRNDRIVICVPIEKYQSGNIALNVLFPYDLSTGAVSANDVMPTDDADLAVLYFRTFFVQVIGSDQFGRATFGGANLFCGEDDIHVPKAGYTKWLSHGTSPGYLGNPGTPGELETDATGAGAPAFATHVALILDTESLPKCTFYIGAVTANLY